MVTEGKAVWRPLAHNEHPLPRPDAGATLPTPAIGRWDDPAGYEPSEALLDAANVAIWLGQPLLLTGEPGCGKTEFANHLAWRLGLAHPVGHWPDGRLRYDYALRYDIKSETRARDLFYTIDTIERFHAAHGRESSAPVDPLNYIRFQALGRAILYARPPDTLCKRLPADKKHPGHARRSVVLIDEIDKAPRDVPNDLLMEIEQMRFHMPELDRTIDAPPELRPILIITSNSEKSLPDAFLRRCVYHDVTFPDQARLCRIVARRLAKPGARDDRKIDDGAQDDRTKDDRTKDDRTATAPAGSAAESRLVKDAVALFAGLHGLALNKKPGTAELLGFIQALLDQGLTLDDQLDRCPKWDTIAQLTLLKTRDDRGRAIKHLASPTQQPA